MLTDLPFRDWQPMKNALACWVASFQSTIYQMVVDELLYLLRPFLLTKSGVLSRLFTVGVGRVVKG